MAWANGSGMSGCLFDNGPNHGFETRSDAIDDLCQTFDDRVPTHEQDEMRATLLSSGAYWFHDPSEAGAQYCEVFESDEESDQ